jgi:hypothetical protein
VFDNKGHPVRTFEPFFTDSPRYEPNASDRKRLPSASTSPDPNLTDAPL